MAAVCTKKKKIEPSSTAASTEPIGSGTATGKKRTELTKEQRTEIRNRFRQM